MDNLQRAREVAKAVQGPFDLSDPNGGYRETARFSLVFDFSTIEAFIDVAEAARAFTDQPPTTGYIVGGLSGRLRQTLAALDKRLAEKLP